HDPAAAAGAKFSPRRDDHTHYKLEAGTLVLAAEGENYREACRLIRVAGIFNVAADMSNDYMNLLDTQSSGRAPEPTTSAVTGYQDFVIGYLDQRYRAPTPGSASQYNNRTQPDPATFAATNNVQTPRPEQNFAANDGLRWLHARGLYVDYLEKEAV